MTLKQMTKFLVIQHIKFHLKRLGWVGEVLSYENWHIDLYVNYPRFDSVSPNFGAIFSRISSFGLSLVGRSVF